MLCPSPDASMPSGNDSDFGIPPNVKDESSSPRPRPRARTGSDWAVGMSRGSGGGAGASSSSGRSTSEIVACGRGKNIERLREWSRECLLVCPGGGTPELVSVPSGEVLDVGNG